jgi:hypothetical protein
MFTEDVANFLTRHLGVIPYLVLTFALFFVVPVRLAVRFGRLEVKAERRRRDGVLFGFGIATWASLCWLTVPYCGGYPCLPALIVLLAFGSAPVETLTEEMRVHAVNFVVWPLFFWLMVRLRKESAQIA